MCGKNMVAMSGTSQSGAGSNYPLGFQGGALMYVEGSDKPMFCGKTFGCFVTIFIVTKCYAFATRRRRRKKKKTTIQHSREQR